MKAQLKKSVLRLSLPLGFSALMLATILCGLSQVTEADLQVLPMATARVASRPNVLDYQTGVSICQQTENLAPNPGFEHGGGAPWKPDSWYEAGVCIFSFDYPGPSSDVSAGIFGSYPKDTRCALFTSIQEILIQGGRSYDYSAWVRADLAQGDTYLQIVFWSWQEEPPGWKYEGAARTRAMTDTQGAWVQVTGSVLAPADAEYARIEAVLPDSSLGMVWFDDVFLGLATCLDINKSDAPALVAPGGMLTYTIVYSNTGREKATDVQIIEMYDPYVDFVVTGTQPPPDWSTNIWEIPELFPGIGGTVTAVVRVKEDTGERTTLINAVQIRSDETIEPAHDVISTSVTGAGGCDIALYLPDVGKSGESGRPTDYDLILYNVGSCIGLADLAATSSQGWNTHIAPEEGPYTMLPGGSKLVTLSLSVPADAPGGTKDVTLITAALTCDSPCTGMAMATATVTTTVKAVLLTGVTVDGPTRGGIAVRYAFTANTSPNTAARPITYVWEATEQSEVVTTTDAPSHTVQFTWGVTGTQTITVTAINVSSTVTDTHVITIAALSPKIYLPQVARNRPPSPHLYGVDNMDGDDNYSVTWSAVYRATFYVLEEAIDGAFADAIEVYTGSDTSYTINDRGAARYYYRVKACTGQMCSGWSNVEQVDVLCEAEPNDDALTQANGPIVSGLTYYGSFPHGADVKDYFFFDLSSSHSVEIWLTNIPSTRDYDLALRDANLVPPIAYSVNPGNADEHILTDVLPAGRYYVQVYNYSGPESTQPYHLRVVYE